MHLRCACVDLYFTYFGPMASPETYILEAVSSVFGMAIPPRAGRGRSNRQGEVNCQKTETIECHGEKV